MTVDVNYVITSPKHLLL